MMTTENRKQKTEDGAALLVVMLVLIIATGTAVFAVRNTSMEMRAAGYSRKAMQTDYVAQSAIPASLTWIDQLGVGVLYALMQTTANANGGTPISLAPFEPDMPAGTPHYRLFDTDFTTAFGATATDDEAFVGAGSLLSPLTVVDINDVYLETRDIPGQRSDGQGSFEFLHITLTARGRARIDGDITVDDDPGREFHESATDARAYIVAGPFMRSQ